MIILLKYFRLHDCMTRQYGYTPRNARRALFRLMCSDRTVKQQLARFYAGATPVLRVGGVSYADLTAPDKFGMNPFAALLFLDWMIRDPHAALRSLTLPRCGFRPACTREQIDPALLPDIDRYLRRQPPEPQLSEEERIETDNL